MDRQTFEGPQGKLAFSARPGTGLPIVFLHGDSCRASQWQHVIDRLPAGVPAAAPDFRGHGGSDPAADGDYSNAARAADVQALLGHLGWHTSLVVAHSGGAAVALAFAARRPECVRALALVEPPGDPRAIPPEALQKMVHDLEGPDSLAAQQAFYRSIAGADPATVEEVLRDAASTAPDARLGVAKAMAGWKPEEAFAACRVPVRLLLAQGGAAAAMLPQLGLGVRASVIDGTGHWPQLDRPDDVAGFVLDALADLDAME